MSDPVQAVLDAGVMDISATRNADIDILTDDAKDKGYAWLSLEYFQEFHPEDARPRVRTAYYRTMGALRELFREVN